MKALVLKEYKKYRCLHPISCLVRAIKDKLASTIGWLLQRRVEISDPDNLYFKTHRASA